MAKATKALGYVRVSTARQGESGLGLAAQRATLERVAKERGLELVGVLEEVESGSRRDRPVLVAAVQRCHDERLALAVARLDRLGRVAAHLLALRDAGVAIVAGDVPGSLEGPSATMLFGVLATVAQAEREATSARTKAALQAAKARGAALGNPRAREAATKGRAERTRRAQAWAEALRPLVEYLLRDGARSAAGLAQALEARGARAPAGGTRWSAAQAQRLAARLAIPRGQGRRASLARFGWERGDIVIERS